jgi:hypothetical protein
VAASMESSASFDAAPYAKKSATIVSRVIVGLRIRAATAQVTPASGWWPGCALANAGSAMAEAKMR